LPPFDKFTSHSCRRTPKLITFSIAPQQSLAITLLSENRLAEAERLLRKTLDSQRRVLRPDDPHTADSMYGLGCLAALQGRKDEALSLLREAVDHGLPVPGDLAIEKEDSLKSLHGDPRFVALVASAKPHAAATQTPK
jgi:hypothetical protein